MGPSAYTGDLNLIEGSEELAVVTGNIVLAINNPEDVVNLIKLLRSTFSKMVQNLA